MTDADSTWERKLSRLQDPNLEKMKPLVELMEELRERRQERGEPRSGPQALRRAHSASRRKDRLRAWSTMRAPYGSGRAT